jgi:hypothetical protein
VRRHDQRDDTVGPQQLLQGLNCLRVDVLAHHDPELPAQDRPDLPIWLSAALMSVPVGGSDAFGAERPTPAATRSVPMRLGPEPETALTHTLSFVMAGVT